METVIVSSQFQVSIPPSILKQLAVRPGHQLRVIPYDHRIEFIPVTPPNAWRGFLKGIDTTVEREDDRV